MRVLLVEDDQALSKALRTGLSDAGFAVDAVGCLTDGRRLLRVNPYDLVVLDLGLPDGDGLALVREIRAAKELTPVLILTARGSVEERVLGLDAGADDYLQKPFAFPELVARGRALMRRTPNAALSVLQTGEIVLDPSRLEVTCSGVPIKLTVKEFAILEYLMRNAGHLVTRTAILEHCWDESYEGLSNLVDVHVSRVRKKLGMTGSGSPVRTVRGVGFIFEEHAG